MKNLIAPTVSTWILYLSYCYWNFRVQMEISIHDSLFLVGTTCIDLLILSVLFGASYLYFNQE